MHFEEAAKQRVALGPRFGAVRVIVVGGLVGGMGVGGFVRGPVTLSRFARRFWFCPFGATGFGFLDGRLVGVTGGAGTALCFFWSGGRWMGLGLAGFDVEVVGGFGGVAVVGDLVAAVGAVDGGMEIDAQGAPFAFD